MNTHASNLTRRSGSVAREGTLAVALLATILVAAVPACDGVGTGAGVDAGPDGSPDSSPAQGWVGACTGDAQCGSGFCVDGVCCDSACDGSCRSCALTGKVGTCSPITSGDDDACAGESTCDSRGRCMKKLGSACSGSKECVSDSCVDGVCCGSAACGACQSCAVDGSAGTCAPVVKVTETVGCEGATFSSLPVSGASTCQAKRADGNPCTSDVQCLNGSCRVVYRDGDGDGYAGTAVTLCLSPTAAPPAGYAAGASDCCDSDAGAHPGVTSWSAAPNACGTFDWDCDGVVTATSSGTCGCATISTGTGAPVLGRCIGCR